MRPTGTNLYSWLAERQKSGMRQTNRDQPLQLAGRETEVREETDTQGPTFTAVSTLMLLGTALTGGLLVMHDALCPSGTGVGAADRSLHRAVGAAVALCR